MNDVKQRFIVSVTIGATVLYYNGKSGIQNWTESYYGATQMVESVAQEVARANNAKVHRVM